MHVLDATSIKEAKQIVEENWDWTPKRMYPRQQGIGQHRLSSPDFYRMEFENRERFEKVKDALNEAGINHFTIE